MTKKADKAKAVLRRKKKLKAKPVYLNSGSTLLNLACTGRIDGAFPTGKYVFFVGDSNSGKTFLGLTCLAEASIDPRFKGYRFIYDATENGALMDIKKFFGQGVFDRLEPPRRDEKGNPVYSVTAEDFYWNLDDAFEDSRPFIYIQDSQDALTSIADEKKFSQNKRKARKTATEDEEGKSTGSFGDGKAKVHSANIRRFITRLEKTGSILIILNQTRDSFSMFEKSTYSGGRALRFYAHFLMWASVREQIQKTVRGKKRQLGVKCKVQVKKNRVTGKDRVVYVPIFHSFGVDDIGSCIDYLVDEGEWSKSKSGMIKASGLGPGFDDPMRSETLIKWIEENELEDDLRDLVGITWSAIEEACEVHRKSRYNSEKGE